MFDRGAFVFVNTLTSGRADLKPEKSESLNLGAVWTPIDGLELGVDRYMTKSSFQDQSLLTAVFELIGAPEA